MPYSLYWLIQYQDKSCHNFLQFFSYGTSAISNFHTALGQFLNYRIMLEVNDPERLLYLAIPFEAYQTFFQSR